MLAVAGTFFVSGWLIPIGANVIKKLRRDPLVQNYRASLDYTSAVVGDALHLPLLDALIADHLDRHPPSRAAVARALAFGFALTSAAHIAQARSGAVNWQMPHPWQWTPLGYEHYFNQAFETSLYALYFGKAIARLRSPQATSFDRKEFGVALAALASFVAMLAGDYQE